MPTVTDMYGIVCSFSFLYFNFSTINMDCLLKEEKNKDD